MDIFIKGFPFRHAMGIVFAVFVWWTSVVSKETDGEFPLYYYIVIIILFLIHQVNDHPLTTCTQYAQHPIKGSPFWLYILA